MPPEAPASGLKQNDTLRAMMLFTCEEDITWMGVNRSPFSSVEGASWVTGTFNLASITSKEDGIGCLHSSHPISLDFRTQKLGQEHGPTIVHLLHPVLPSMQPIFYLGTSVFGMTCLFRAVTHELRITL